MRLFRRTVRAPSWGLEVGDVLAFDLPAGDVARLQIVNMQRPNKHFDYLRLTAVVIDPEKLDLSGEPGDDSVVPVGAAAEPIAFDLRSGGRDLLAYFAATLPVVAGRIVGPTPARGLVVIVPGDDGGSADDPARAGFRLVQKAAPPVIADGYAILMDWPELADRLLAGSSSR